MRARLASSALLLLLLSSVRPAWSQSSTDSALAETLYRQGRDLMTQGKAAEACPKFAESQRLDPATGTMLNLAACYEAVGKLASAWLAYTEAAVAARRDQREDRVRFAQERIQRLEPQLSRLTITLAPGADASGLQIHLNGALWGEAARGVPTPVDPGVYRIEATAPGKKAWHEAITIGKVRENRTLVVPRLKDEPVAAGTSTRTEGAPVAPDQIVKERPLTAPIYVAAGTSVALAAAAVVTGLSYMKRKSDYEASNDDPNATVDERRDLHDSAQAMSIVSTALTAAAVVTTGITVGLYLTRPERSRSTQTGFAGPKRGVRLSGFVLPGSGGLCISGRL
jgi:hypothetical protein